MTHLSRRGALALAVGAAASPLLPPVSAVAAVAPPPSLPAFAVGIYGEHNWRVFFAATVERAKQLWFEELGPSDPADFDFATLDVDDVSFIDAKSSEECGHNATAADCLAMGWDSNCDRCYNDVSVDGDNYHAINGECVCQECMTPQEVDAYDHDDFLNNFLNENYDASDPAIFALLRPADFLDDTIREVLAEEAALHPGCLHLMPFARQTQTEAAPSTDQHREDE